MYFGKTQKKNSGYTENYSYFSLSGNETRFTNSSISKVKIKSIENQNLIGLISK
jgi:hypothetical protein